MIQTLLGKKLGMTQIYDGSNTLVPVTVVEAGPCPVVQVKTADNDGYDAVQIAFGKTSAKRISAPEKGHLAKAGVDAHTALQEIRLSAPSTLKTGDVVTVETAFKEGQMVDVLGVTKGKGFQGVVKRFRVGGGPASHGSMFHRRIGSIGMRQTPGRTWKNQAMPGHMGSVNRTVQNLRIVKIVAEKNLVLVRGSVPGANGDQVLIRAAIKARS
ncbi:50S ribosomal protein L3 [Opitutales bacterium ASA1]|uniref:50S ribosomal protein L3 n=1 Tax=Congregicoccus parvus TaxID=3081749 RepID=UPI002B28844E|nr:50S ribosomal protein L3 [Opitutales bacterium ASA1]